ncbi:pre-mRNA-processing factor 39-like isoform X1 [Diabrotica undecimpunctata]|uniref:pre-mRNA-processing factor 39-like isoform X1 n=2 Tax=Diabrotica undecimpunctata TaxID=50387 RepID=UPI003B633526
MEGTEGTTGRKTRSSAAKSTPVVTKKEKPGPLSRKTRKKVVLMEVEVSDEEVDETVQEPVSEEMETTEETKQSEKQTDTEKVNGKENKPTPIEDQVILNDVTVLCEMQTESNKTEDTEKMEVDGDLEIKKTEDNVSSQPTEESKVESLEKLDTKSNVCELKEEEPAEKKIKLEEKPTDTDSNKKVVDRESENDVINTNKKEVKTESEKNEKENKEVKGKTEEETEKQDVAKVEEDTDKTTKVEEDTDKTAKVEEKEEDKGEIKIEENKVEEKITKEEEKKEDQEEIKVEEKKVKDIAIEKSEKECEESKEEKEIKEITTEDKSEKEDEKSEDKNKKGDEESLVKDAENKDDLTKVEQKEAVSVEGKEDTEEETLDKQKADPDTENISEDELPVVQAVKVPEAEEVSDEELPGPKRAELPADTEVVSEDELPTVKNDTKKESNKRKLNATDYDPGSPTSENEAPSKKPSLDSSVEKDKEEKPKPKKLPELDKYWKAVNDDPTDFTGWTYLLQYVDQENDMEAAREAYDAFLSHYPYCYGYWRKYADYEKRKGNKKKCEEVFERGLKAIPLSVDLWIHYLTYVKVTRTDDEEFIRSQFERAVAACGLEFRSDRLWDSYIKWEIEAKRLQKVTAIYDRLLGTPTQGYTTHFENFQEHISSNVPNKVIDVDEFLALRKEVRQQLKHEITDTPPADNDAPPGDEDQTKVISSDEETKILRERIISIRRKLHKNTVTAVTARWNYEEAIKRPYFHVKPLERCQLKNWQDYLDYETEQGDRVRIIVLFERCLIACALYEEFWLKFVHYLENLRDHELQPKIRDVYERACTIHHLKKPNLHLQWAIFEEGVDNVSRAAEILVNLEKSVPNVLQIAYRRINLERRRGDNEKCCQLFEHYISSTKNKIIASSISIKYSRFAFFIMKDVEKAQTILKSAIAKDPNNPRLYLQLVDLTLHKGDATENDIIEILNMFLDKDNIDGEQKMLFAQRKLEYLEDFGSNLQLVQDAHEQYQKLVKQNKEAMKKKEIKSETAGSSSKSKETKPPPQSSQGNYGNYNAPYGPPSNQPSYPPYSGGSQQGPNYYPPYGQGDQYQYQNWQYPQGGYGGYNQWSGYGGGYGY